MKKEKSKKYFEGSGIVAGASDNPASSIAKKGIEKYRRKHLFFDNRIAVEWLTTKEAAVFLRMTPNALRILVHRGRLKAYKIGSRLRFRLLDLESILLRKEDICPS